MSSSLGIYASQISGHLSTNNFSSIATVLGNGSSSTITFSSIPSTYTHLQLRISTVTYSAGSGFFIRMNSDSGTNYSYHYLNGNGSGASSGAFTSTTFISPFGVSYGTQTTSPSVSIIDILDYTNTNKNKTTRALSGMDNNGSGELQLFSGLWMNTAAITNLTLTTLSSTTYSTGSTFALYGVK